MAAKLLEGLIGCLDGTGITSENYKEILNGHGWIKCTDRLPDRDEFILLGWTGAHFIPYDKIDRKTMRSTCADLALTHWMPVPGPPK